MSYKMILAAAALAAGTSPASAQSFTGASVGVDYHDFSDVTNLSRTSIFGSGEMAFTSNISAAADFTSYSYESGAASTSNFLLHGIYAMSSTTALGLFIGQDRTEVGELDVLGAEAKVGFVGGSAEIYFGSASDAADSADMFGIAGEYEVMRGISVTGQMDMVMFPGDLVFSQFDIGGQYALPTGGKVYATIGSYGIDDPTFSISEPTYSIGASFDFGPQGGTTFGRRSIFEALAL